MSRSKYKGPFFKKNLFKNNKKIQKIHSKNLIILPEYINKILEIHNGKIYVKLRITDKMVGYKIGEFIYTRKKHIFKFKKKK